MQSVEPVRTSVWVALSITLLSWASAFSSIRVGLAHFSPGSLTLYRMSVASLTLLLIGAARGLARPRREDLPGIAACGFLGAAAYHTLLNYGQVTVKAGPAAFLINTAPLYTALLARLVLKERLSRIGYAGMVLSFCGVALIVAGSGKTLDFDPNAVLVFLAALSASVYMIVQKPYLARYDALSFTAYMFVAGTLFLLVFLPQTVRDMQSAGWQAHANVIYLGVVPAALGYATWTYVVAQMPASRAVSFLYLTPVLATAVAWVWLSEVPGPLALLGGVVVLCGVIAVQRYGRAQSAAART